MSVGIVVFRKGVSCVLNGGHEGHRSETNLIQNS